MPFRAPERKRSSAYVRTGSAEMAQQPFPKILEEIGSYSGHVPKFIEQSM